jgi:predicted transcriptional regulator
MIAKELISDKIPPIMTSESGLEALAIMDEYRVSHLPIVNNEEFLGLISEEDIFDLNHFEESVGNHQLSLNRPFVTENQHVYDVIKLIAEMKLSLVPVLDSNNNYLGIITRQALVECFAEFSAVQNPGGIIVLDLNEKDYSLSEIAQIVESNDARILSIYIRSYQDSTRLEITLKINKMDITSIISTFNRYDYTIKASFSASEYDDYLRDRFDSLMAYLNI